MFTKDTQGTTTFLTYVDLTETDVLDLQAQQLQISYYVNTEDGYQDLDPKFGSIAAA